MLASKYQRYGFVYKEPFEPGDRLRCAREIDRSVKGAKEARQELKEARKRVKEVEEETHRKEMMKQIKTSFYKSPVGTRTTKLAGGVFHSQYTAKNNFFSDMKIF